jgi:hypothetical protein
MESWQSQVLMVKYLVRTHNAVSTLRSRRVVIVGDGETSQLSLISL